MPEHPIHDIACQIVARDGVVTIAGPDDIEISLTPDAAVETSDRLLHGAMKARGQQHFDDRRALIAPKI